MKKRLMPIVLVMALLVTVALSACQEAPKSSEPASTEPASTEPASTIVEETSAPALTGPGLEGMTPFAERIKITVPVYDRSKEGYPAVDDNYWTRWVQKEFGDKVNVDVTYVAIPRGDVMTKYNLLITAGDTPTIMMEYDYPKVAQWANDGAMGEIDLDKFKAVAPNYYQSMVDNNQLGYTDINGKTYFVLSERPYYNTTFTFATFVRRDWLEQLGLGMPTNYAEYSNAIDSIRKAGISKIPMGLALPFDAYSRNFGFRNFPVSEEEWVMHSSLGTSSLPWYPTERMLRRQNAEYNKGWYSSEYDLNTDVTGASSQMQTDFVNGKTFSYGGYMSASVEWLTAFYENNPGAKLGILDPNFVQEPGVADVTQIRADNPFGMIVGFSSLATADQLKAAWMLMEWMHDPEVLFTLENGVEGVTYKLGANGLPVVDAEYRGEEMLNHNMNIDMACLVHASKKVGTIEQTIAAIAPQKLPQDFTQELLENYNKLKKIADDGRAYSDPIFAVAIASESEYSASLLPLWQEYSVKLTKCKPGEFDALYAKFSKDYLSAGYQEIIDERLAAYKAGKTTKLP